jgi:hypothetical protein
MRFMTTEMRSRVTQQAELIPKKGPQEIRKQDLLDEAKTEFTSLFTTSGIWAPLLKFVDKKVTGVHMNGVDVIFIDTEHNESGLDYLSQAYINSPRTSAIVTEYFDPELRNNIPAWFRKKAEKSNEGYRRRFRSTKEKEEVLRDSQKPVVVADPADRVSYELIYRATRTVLPLASGAAAAAGLVSQTGGAPGMIGAAAVGLLALRMWRTNHQEVYGKGMFNRTKPTDHERLIPDLEQARRLFVARHLEDLTKEYAPQINSDITPRIIVLYPKAHRLRLMDRLLNPTPHLDQIQTTVYKTLFPMLDFSRRTYRWKNSLQQLAVHEGRSGEGLAGWMRVSKNAI